MQLSDIAKVLVFVISFTMFCYQLNTATNNLIEPPKVISIYERNVEDDDIPLILICPTKQINHERLTELKYFGHLDAILYGKTYCQGYISCTTWGAHFNLTFSQVLAEVHDLDKVGSVNTYGTTDNLVFIPRYGMCKEISHFDITQEMFLDHTNADMARILVTDRNYRSYFMIDLASHIGTRVFMQTNKIHYINVQIQVKLYCKKDEKPMKENDFQKCVDDKIMEVFQQNNIDCVPPWLSMNNQCNQTYWDYYGDFELEFYTDYVSKVITLSNIKVEEECRQSCKEITYLVSEREVMDNENEDQSWAFISFNQKVVVTEKVPNYDMFQYIIDVGSSLGLWLGLSVFGLHDMVVMALKFFKTRCNVKRFRFAVFK